MSSEKKEPQVNASQPAPTPGMTINPRNALNLPVDNEGKRDWSFGLLNCFGDVETCCWACWCPCLVHGRTRRRLAHLNQQNAPAPDRQQFFGDGDSALYAFVEICCDMGWLLQIATRQAIRERYNIRGDGMTDCCAPFCCQICDLVQGHREVELEEQQLVNMGVVAQPAAPGPSQA